MKARLNELHKEVYDEDGELTTISDCHQVACKLCHEMDIEPPHVVDVPTLEAIVEQLQTAVLG